MRLSWAKSFWTALNRPLAPAIVYVEGLDDFTPRARQVLEFSREEAGRLNHYFVGTEHVLIGIARVEDGVGVEVLRRRGLSLDRVRKEVETQVGTGPGDRISGHIPFTPRVKKVFALAKKEAAALNHTYVGTEHLLLGLLREADGVAARVLTSFNLPIEVVRAEILKQLDPKSNRNVARLNLPDFTISSAAPTREPLDTFRLYDLHCRGQRDEVVYRNALFKGIKTLLESETGDVSSEFMELELDDGQTIFVAKSSITKFSESAQSPGPHDLP